MKFIIALGLFAILAPLSQGRYINPCNAPCDVELYGKFPICMSDGSVVCGWCRAKEISCDTGNAIKQVLGEKDVITMCGRDWRTRENCEL